MELTDKQRKRLRGLAHPLRAVTRLGSAGVTGEWLAELDRALEHHELLKVKFAAGSREARDAAIEETLKHSGAALVTRIGNVAVLYRPRAENPGLVLPPD